MASNTGLKRDPVKYIRDGIKANYKKDCKCAICSTDESLELHHYHSVSFLLEKYAKEKGLSLSSKEQVLEMRDGFYKIHWHELIEDTVTLCSRHHILLHKIYGQKPLLHTASKQRVWVKKQNDKFNGIAEENEVVNSSLSLCKYSSPETSLLSFMV